VATKQTEGKSVHTADWYRRMLGRFAAYASNGSAARLQEATTAWMFIGSLREQSTRYAEHPIKPERDGGLSPSTVHQVRPPDVHHQRSGGLHHPWLPDMHHRLSPRVAANHLLPA
jgi:hypothetical protein